MAHSYLEFRGRDALFNGVQLSLVMGATTREHENGGAPTTANIDALMLWWRSLDSHPCYSVIWPQLDEYLQTPEDVATLRALLDAAENWIGEMGEELSAAQLNALSLPDLGGFSGTMETTQLLESVAKFRAVLLAAS